MSEPTVTVPLRVAFLVSRLLNSNKQFGGQKLNGWVDEIQGEIVDAICNQCSKEEIHEAAVAVKMQESQFT